MYLIRGRNCLPFASTCVHPWFLVVSPLLIFLVFCVVLWCIFTFWVPSCDFRYDFRIKNDVRSSLDPIVCRRTHVLFTIFFVCLPIVVSSAYCVVFLFCFSSSFIPYVASFSVLLFCFSSSFIPYVASFSGLSFCACPFGILWRKVSDFVVFNYRNNVCEGIFCIRENYLRRW
jgi:hypothetical protein